MYHFFLGGGGNDTTIFGSGSSSNQGMIQMDLPTLPLSSGKFGRFFNKYSKRSMFHHLHSLCTQSSFVTPLPKRLLYLRRVEIILKTRENRSFSCKSVLTSGGQQKSPETAQSLRASHPFPTKNTCPSVPCSVE